MGCHATTSNFQTGFACMYARPVLPTQMYLLGLLVSDGDVDSTKVGDIQWDGCLIMLHDTVHVILHRLQIHLELTPTLREALFA